MLLYFIVKIFVGALLPKKAFDSGEHNSQRSQHSYWSSTIGLSKGEYITALMVAARPRASSRPFIL